MTRLRQIGACCGIQLLVAACTPDAKPGPSHEHDDHAKHEPGEAPHAGDDARLRVDPGMLRDLRITTHAAQSRPAGDTVSVLGELRVDEDAYAEIGTPIPARVARVHAAPGDVVHAGAPLVELQSAEIGRARAALLTGQARLVVAQQTAERRRELQREQLVSQRDLEAAEAALAEARAETRAAQLSLSALGASPGGGARLSLRSPIAGTVLQRHALRGRLVDDDEPLFVVADLRKLWLVVHAFERDALRIREGGTAHVTFPALPGRSFTGTVTRIGTHVDLASRTLDVRVEVDNPEGVLRPGMSATALLATGDTEQQVVAVPLAALQRQASGWCVFLPTGEPGVFETRAVGRGRDLGGDVEVLSGLRAGERVVVDGAFLLKAEADKTRGGADEHHH